MRVSSSLASCRPFWGSDSPHVVSCNPHVSLSVPGRRPQKPSPAATSAMTKGEAASDSQIQTDVGSLDCCFCTPVIAEYSMKPRSNSDALAMKNAPAQSRLERIRLTINVCTYGLANRKYPLLDAGERRTSYLRFVKSVAAAFVTVTQGPPVGAGLCSRTKLAEGMVQESRGF